MPESFGATETNRDYEELFAGEFPRVTKGAVILTGEGVLAAGTVLGKVTATGKYRAYDDGNVDGSENPVAILKTGVDATSADVKTNIWETGWFRGEKLTGFVEAIRDTLRGLGIHVSGGGA